MKTPDHTHVLLTLNELGEVVQAVSTGPVRVVIKTIGKVSPDWDRIYLLPAHFQIVSSREIQHLIDRPV